jgi:hypothetical protein
VNSCVFCHLSVNFLAEEEKKDSPMDVTYWGLVNVLSH